MYGEYSECMMQILCCCSCRDKSDKIITHMRINCRLLFGIIRIMLEIYNKISMSKNRVLSLGLLWARIVYLLKHNSI